MVEQGINPARTLIDHPSRAALEECAAITGPKGFSTDADEIAPWLRDWRGLYQGACAAMLSPATTQEAAALIKVAARHRIALVPQGGNTSMVGGATPSADGAALILSTRRMNRIRSIDAGAGLAIAEAGVILDNLHGAAEAAGSRFPLTLGARGSATIGGLTATNAGGTQVLRFGTMRALVAGVEAVLPDGTIFHGLQPLKKDTRGVDLVQLLIGSEGTLGLITAVTLRLVPQAKGLATGWAGLANPHRALELLRFCEARSGPAVESFELIPARSLERVLRHIPGTRPPLSGEHGWHVLIDFAGADADARLQAVMAEALSCGLIEDALVAANSAQAAALWRLRETISEAERASGPAIQHDISVPVAAMPAFMIETANAVEAGFPGVSASAFGHLGDGNVHFHVCAPPLEADQIAGWRAGQGKAASDMVYDLVTAAGGSISAEHGIGQMKRVTFARLGDPARLALLRAIKAAIDPLGIMNPGKLVP